MAAPTNDQVEKFGTNLQRLDQFVNGDEATDVETDNGPIPSIAKQAAIATDTAVTGARIYPSGAAGVSNGVVDYLIASPGSGGTDGTYDLTLTGGGGARAKARVTVSGGVLARVTRLSAGDGYTSAPTVSFTVPGMTGGSITAVLGANTTDGEYYLVKDGDSALVQRWKNTAGVATDTGERLINQSAVKRQFGAAHNRNVHPDPRLKLRALTGWYFPFPSSPVSLTESNGAPCVRTPLTTSATASRAPMVPVEQLPGGYFSASVVIREKVGDQGVDGSLRNNLQVRIVAYASNDPATLMSTAWTGYSGNDWPASVQYYTRDVPRSDITAPMELIVASNLPIPEGAAYLGFDIYSNTASVVCDISHLCIRPGPFAEYVDNPDAELDIVDARDEGRRLDFIARPNLFDAAAQGFTALPVIGGVTPTVSTVGGLRCWKLSDVTFNSVENNTQLGPWPVANFPSGKFSFAIRVLSMTSTANGTARVIVRQIASGGAEISAARRTFTFGAAGVPAPTWFRAAGIELDEDCVRVDVYVGVNAGAGSTAVDFNFRDLLLCDGDSAIWREPATPLSGGSSGTTLVNKTTLPDNVLAGTEGKGFACTGLDRDGAWLWIVGNHGQAVPGDPYTPSIVILHPDFLRVYAEIPCLPIYPGIESIQGVAWDSSDDTIWFVDKTNKVIRHISRAGEKLLDEISVSAITPNGLAYDADNDAVWVTAEGTSNFYRYSCATGALQQTLSGMPSDADQLHYDEANQELLVSRGANGGAGQMRVYDVVSGSLLKTVTLEGSESIEGLYRDGKRLWVMNDGAFHTEAKPPLALAIEYLLA